MDHDENDCGHTDQEHLEMHELLHLVEHVRTIADPRVAFILTDSGEVHFATSIAPGQAAILLEEMAAKLRRYPANYMREHFDRSSQAHLN